MNQAEIREIRKTLAGMKGELQQMNTAIDGIIDEFGLELSPEERGAIEEIFFRITTITNEGRIYYDRLVRGIRKFKKHTGLLPDLFRNFTEQDYHNPDRIVKKLLDAEKGPDSSHLSKYFLTLDRVVEKMEAAGLLNREEQTVRVYNPTTREWQPERVYTPTPRGWEFIRRTGSVYWQ